MRLQKGRVYVAYETHGSVIGGRTFAAIRVPPEPPFVLHTSGSLCDVRRYVQSIWPDAMNVPAVVLFRGKVDNRPPAQSLRGKI